jgi:site-specific DNA recombinase
VVPKAAAYLRSSKDRSDVSIAAQERALRELAQARGLLLVETFADAVESGKDEDRPAFQRLLDAVANPRRGWDTLLVLDTARISRRQMHAIIFEEQTCRQAGVTIVYKSLPEGDPVTGVIVKALLRAMDEWHSLNSRAKGLAGMRENVRAGWRAGGRAPVGYRLARVSTGAMRDGLPVQKSRLEPEPAAAPAVADYLTARASGVGRTAAARQAGLALATTSLIGLEANALVYSGHTVWNVAGEKGSGMKRRPRADWVIQRDTHPALIDEATAEAVLALAGAGTRARRARDSTALLGGLLVAPDGSPWHGDGSAYRLRRAGGARTIARSVIEDAVAEQIAADLRAPTLAAGLLAQVRSSLAKLGDSGRLEEARRADVALSRRIATMMDLAAEMKDRAPALRRIEELEQALAAGRQDLVALEAEAAEAKAMAEVSEAQVARVLANLAENLRAANDPSALRAALEGLIEKVELDPDTLRGVVHYRVAAGVKVASPRGTVLIPGQAHVRLRTVLPLILHGARRRST